MARACPPPPGDATAGSAGLNRALAGLPCPAGGGRRRRGSALAAGAGGAALLVDLGGGGFRRGPVVGGPALRVGRSGGAGGALRLRALGAGALLLRRPALGVGGVPRLAGHGALLATGPKRRGGGGVPRCGALLPLVRDVQHHAA